MSTSAGETRVPVMEAPNVLEFPFSRSTGPVIGAFMTALRDEAKILGATTATGKVIVPPLEYDPETGEATTGLVDVGSSGVVTTWAWVREPGPKHPLAKPFAWALIKLDGADTALVHAVDAGSPDAMSTGMRVTAHFKPEREGHIRDISCFVPSSGSAGGESGTPSGGVRTPEEVFSSGTAPNEGSADASTGQADEATGPVRKISTPIELVYRFTAGRATSRFVRGLLDFKILGQRCPSCTKVYVPPRGSCAKCGVATEEEVELPTTGTVTTFCVVNVPFYGQKIKIPYVTATILLDGADIGLFHLIQECEADEVHMGMRVEAVWQEPENMVPGLEAIQHFRPTGEPDADYDTYKEHV